MRLPAGLGGSREYARRAVGRLHISLFGQAIGPFTRQFLGYARLSTIGLIAANAIFFFMVVLGGRILGPVEYGLFSLVWSLSQVLVVLMLLGMDTAVMRQLSVSVPNAARDTRTVSSGFFVVLASITMVVAGLMVLQDEVVQSLRIPQSVLRLSALLATVMALKLFFDAVLRGENAFQYQIKVRMADAGVALLVFLGALMLGRQESYAMLVGAVGIGSLAAIGLARHFSVRGTIRLAAVARKEARRLWQYIRFGLLHANAGGGLLIANIDKLIVERSLGTHSLGIYAAYFFVSVQVANQLAYMLINAFFPMTARHPNPGRVMKKLNRVVAVAFLPAIIGMTGIIALFLKLYSSAYPLSASFVLAMSVYAILFLIWQIYWWFIASTGERGVVYAGIHGLVSGGIYLLGVSLSIRYLGLYAPPVAFGVSAAYFALAVFYWRRRHMEGVIR